MRLQLTFEEVGINIDDEMDIRLSRLEAFMQNQFPSWDNYVAYNLEDNVQWDDFDEIVYVGLVTI